MINLNLLSKETLIEMVLDMNSKLDKPKKMKTEKISLPTGRGNIRNTPHSKHKTKDELLRVSFPKGTLKNKKESFQKDFKKNIDAILYLKENCKSKKLRRSNWTNISAAARGTANYSNTKGWYHGIHFSFINNEE